MGYGWDDFKGDVGSTATAIGLGGLGIPGALGFSDRLGIDLGDPLGQQAAAQTANEAEAAKLAAAQDEAQKARQFLQRQSRMGQKFIDEGTGQAAGSLGDAYRTSTGAYEDASKLAQGTIGRGTSQAAGALGTGYGQGRADVAGMMGQGPGAYNALSQQPGRLADLYGGGLQRDFQESPGYQARLAASEQALGRSAAARGGRLGGAQLAALQANAGNMASQEWGNYVNQRTGLAGAADQQNMQALLNQAGRSDAAAQAGYQGNLGLAGQLGSMAQNYGQNLGSIYQGGASQIAGIQSGLGQQMGGAAQQYGSSLADIYSQAGTNKGNLAIGAAGQNTSLTQTGMQGIMGQTTHVAPGALGQLAPLAAQGAGMYLGAS